MQIGYPYLVTPFLAWLCCGLLKFLINSLKQKKLAFDLIGYGGIPSNHSAIVGSMAGLIAFKEGINTPAFGVALTLAYIVMMDANGLRKKVEAQAIEINKLKNYTAPVLRERVGHSKIEILAGLLLGIILGGLISSL